MNNEITRQDFIDIFTQRPADAGAMPTDELLQRLDITIDTLKEVQGEKQLNVHNVAAANCLRGALIRLAQAYDNAAVTKKVRELVGISAEITGI